MSYVIKYTDEVNKGNIIIDDKSINEETSIKFPGRNTTGYGQIIAESFLHLLENFAAPTQPLNPVEGQLWYDNTPGVDQLKLYDGTTWVAAGGLKKASIPPEAANSVIGDLWVDTDNQQLYLFAGSGWVLVGPQFAEGQSTGTRPAKIVGSDNQEYDVVFVDVAGKPVGILAADSFEPKSTIEGFENGIKPGFNLSATNITGDGIPQITGISEKSLNLFIPGPSEASSVLISASNVMRKDAENISNFPISIKNDVGLSVNNLKLKVDGSVGVLEHSFGLQLRITDSGTAVTIDGNRRVGVNNPSPQTTLDVNGVIQTNNQLKVTSTTVSNSIASGSIVTNGGVGIALDLNVGGQTKIGGPLEVGNLNNLSSNNILPLSDNLVTIGSDSKKFLKIYATEFIGNFRGNVSGSVSGRAGQADKLSAPTVFRMTGQVTSNNVSFDGQQGTITFNTVIDNAFIANQPTTIGTGASAVPVPSEPTDEFLVNKPSGVFKMPRNRIFAAIKGLIPIGTIIPYAGIINDTTPPPEGWLLCDGSNYLISDKPVLHSIIQWSYKSKSQVALETGNGEAWFAVPDLRGRFPLGRDNMGTRPPANRVVNPAADILGASSGQETRAIEINNLPEHEHNMVNSVGEQFYSITDSSTPSADGQTRVVTDLIGNATGGLYERSGGISTNTQLGQPIDIMNPFLSLNYIIYAGD